MKNTTNDPKTLRAAAKVLTQKAASVEALRFINARNAALIRWNRMRKPSNVVSIDSARKAGIARSKSSVTSSKEIPTQFDVMLDILSSAGIPYEAESTRNGSRISVQNITFHFRNNRATGELGLVKVTE